MIYKINYYIYLCRKCNVIYVNSHPYWTCCGIAHAGKKCDTNPFEKFGKDYIRLRTLSASQLLYVKEIFDI